MKKLKLLIIIAFILLISCKTNKIINNYGSSVEYSKYQLKTEFVIDYQSYSFLVEKLNEKYGGENFDLSGGKLGEFRTELKNIPKGGVLNIKICAKNNNVKTIDFVYMIQLDTKNLQESGNKNSSIYNMDKTKNKWINLDEIKFFTDFVIDKPFILIIINSKNTKQRATFNIYPNQIKQQ